ncbi:MAG: Nif11 family protein [Comamonadaceae bacterium]|nr:MAG: Nif11 family protein [Comamonadaceae bacterium]
MRVRPRMQAALRSRRSRGTWRNDQPPRCLSTPMVEIVPVSLDALNEFRARLSQDAALQKACADALRANDFAPVIAAAAERGLAITPEELAGRQGAPRG